MSEPTVTSNPAPDTVGNVLADVHKLLDDAKTEIGGCASVLGGDVRQVVHDGLDEIKARLAKLLGREPASVVDQAPVPTTVPAPAPASGGTVVSSAPSSAPVDTTPDQEPSTPTADPVAGNTVPTATDQTPAPDAQ